MELIELLEHTYLSGGFTTRSDMARLNAELVAEAATKGLLTTETPRDGFLSVWRLTAEGLDVLWDEMCPEYVPDDLFIINKGDLH